MSRIEHDSPGRSSEWWWSVTAIDHRAMVAALRRALTLAHSLDERRESADLDRARHGVSHELETVLKILEAETDVRSVRLMGNWPATDPVPNEGGTQTVGTSEGN